MAQAVRDVMTPDVKACAATGTIAEAARLMRDNDIGDVVVTQDDGTMCGIVTDRDIAIRAVAEGRDPGSTQLEEICSRQIVSIRPDQDVEEAATLMREKAVRRLPVCEDGKPVGMVSIGDLALERDPDSALADISATPGNA